MTLAGVQATQYIFLAQQDSVCLAFDISFIMKQTASQYLFLFSNGSATNFFFFFFKKKCGGANLDTIFCENSSWDSKKTTYSKVKKINANLFWLILKKLKTTFWNLYTKMGCENFSKSKLPFHLSALKMTKMILPAIYLFIKRFQKMIAQNVRLDEF